MTDLKSSSKTDGYVKRFRFSESDEKIIMFFINNNNKPAYAAEIESKTGITRKTVGKRCKILKDRGIILSELKLAKSHPYTHYYQLTEFADVLKYLDIYGFSDFYDRIMQTDYYRTQIENLIEHFDNILKSAGYKALTKDDKEVLQICLKYSWTGLSVVLDIKEYISYSKNFISQYKHTRFKHWKEGVDLLLLNIDNVLNKTKTVGEKEKPILKKEIDKKAVSILDLQIEICSNMLEKNIIPFLFDELMHHDSYFHPLSKFGGIEQLELDRKKLHLIIDNIMSEFVISNARKIKNRHFQ